MQVINQPWDGADRRLGDHLVKLLAQDAPAFQMFRVCVAYATSGGLLRLAPGLRAFIERGGRVEMVVGVDGEITTREALELVLRFSSESYVYSNPQSAFHPKVYLFEAPGQAVAIVGSNNLTVGGLYINSEVSLVLQLDLGVAAEKRLCDDVLAVFQRVTEESTGNAVKLTPALIARLAKNGEVSPEAQSRTRRAAASRSKNASIFPPSPVPPPPAIDPRYVHLVSKPKRTGNARADLAARIELSSWKSFVMTLGARDTRQKKGYSRDIFIPLVARDSAPDFWGWRKRFHLPHGRTKGHFRERRINVLVRPAQARAQLVQGVRLYYYDEKKEFRLNCGALVRGAAPGDLLVVQRMPAGTPYKGHNYEFEAYVVSGGDPVHRALTGACGNPTPGSKKMWGYL